MGLDQYGMVVKRHPDNTDFEYVWNNAELYNMDEFNQNVMRIAQWRKHPYLQQWMENLFNAKANRLGHVGKLASGGMTDGLDFNVQIIGADGTPAELDEDVMQAIEEIKTSLISKKEELKKDKPIERVFNCQPIRLNISDLEQLETAINRGELPEGGGFFWGDDASNDYKPYDLQFVEAARQAIAAGYDIYYDSWW